MFVVPPEGQAENAIPGQNMRVALVHYWLLGRRGGEKVLESICRMFPLADIFTLFYEPGLVSPLIRSRNVIPSFLNPLRKFHRGLLPLMPLAIESFDLRKYDLVISSESGPAKGVITSATTRHFCYCHTPMRYLWELYPAYRNEFGSVLHRVAMAPFATFLRTWDYSTAARVDGFVANSRNVRQRIWKTYRRESRVVYPPVDIETCRYRRSEGYFLMVSEMVPYKRLDYAISLFHRTGRRLKIVGGGPDYARLRNLASGTIEFCGRVTDSELRDIYAGCEAFIMPGEEDFGITMVEALASGKPVIALGQGGALEIVRDGCGILFPEPTEAALQTALHKFDQVQDAMSASLMQSRATRFSEPAFQIRFRNALSRMWKDSKPPAARRERSLQKVHN
jgi:glycosyltransferase involved in cell wall biosynthesis